MSLFEFLGRTERPVSRSRCQNRASFTAKFPFLEKKNSFWGKFQENFPACLVFIACRNQVFRFWTFLDPEGGEWFLENSSIRPSSIVWCTYFFWFPICFWLLFEVNQGKKFGFQGRRIPRIAARSFDEIRRIRIWESFCGPFWSFSEPWAWDSGERTIWETL